MPRKRSQPLKTPSGTTSKRVHLRYISHHERGIQRKGRPGSFHYLDSGGRKIRDARTLARIRSLVLPPAWTNVWICPNPNGHLQAIGRDARGRKQYRYHSQWRKHRDQTKFHSLVEFGSLLPHIRRHIRRDMRITQPHKRQVLAAIVRLLDETGMRVGNEQYTRTNHSYGLTTLRDRHVKVRGGEIHFRFVGKSGIDHQVELSDRRLSRLVKRCRDIPGHELFQYRDERGRRHKIDSGDVNSYLHKISGQDVTAKEFRTWRGSVLAVELLSHATIPKTESKRNKLLVDVVKRVAVELGNTPAICKKCYIHPAVLNFYADSSPNQRGKLRSYSGKRKAGLMAPESLFLRILALNENPKRSSA